MKTSVISSRVIWAMGVSILCVGMHAAQPVEEVSGERRAIEERTLTPETLDRKILPSDGIVIEVFDEKLLSVERRVQAGGTISYPLLGTIEVAGKTTSEVADMIAEMLAKDYLVDPQVTVTVREYRERTVSVSGAVNQPGAVPIPAEQRIDILEAIARAGDFRPGANRNKIELTRNGKTITTGYDELKRQPDEKKIWLEPGDLIRVHERFF